MNKKLKKALSLAMITLSVVSVGITANAATVPVKPNSSIGAKWVSNSQPYSGYSGDAWSTGYHVRVYLKNLDGSRGMEVNSLDVGDYFHVNYVRNGWAYNLDDYDDYGNTYICSVKYLTTDPDEAYK